jgi:MFS family permease
MEVLSRPGAFTLLAVATTTIMVGCVIVPGLPAIAAQLGVGSAAAGWLVTVPSLGVILFAPLAARLIERCGSHRALCLGLFAYGLLGAGGMLLRGPLAVFGDRLLLGGATAVVMAAGTGLISAFYAGRERLSMIARQGMAIELGGVLFLFAGGLLASTGWRLPFLLYLIGWLLLAMVVRWVPAPSAAVEAPTPSGRGADLPATLPWICAAALLAMVLFFTAVIVLPLRLRAFGFGEAPTGYFLSFVSLVAVAAAACMPKLVRRLGEGAVLALAFACFGLGHLCFAIATTPAHLLPGALALGAGFGFSVPLVNAMTVQHSQAAARPRALGRLSMAIFGGQFLASFMELAGGASVTVFGSAALIGVVVAALTMAGRRRLLAPATD